MLIDFIISKSGIMDNSLKILYITMLVANSYVYSHDISINEEGWVEYHSIGVRDYNINKEYEVEFRMDMINGIISLVSTSITNKIADSFRSIWSTEDIYETKY
jgi:hypothetical protein